MVKTSPSSGDGCRVSHRRYRGAHPGEECIFMLMGKVIEHSLTGELFVMPKNTEAADYIEGRYG